MENQEPKKFEVRKKFEVHQSPEDFKRELFGKLEEVYAGLDRSLLDMDMEKREELKKKVKEVMAAL